MLGIQPALSYPTPVDFDGKLLRWAKSPGDAPLTYEIITDNESITSEYSSAIYDSAALWNNVTTSHLRLQLAQEGEVADITFQLPSSIEGGDFSAGYSQFDAFDDDGPIHCEIYIAVNPTTAYVPFAKTALHELGHCLGLGHSLIPEAIMSYDLDKNRFGLDLDDRAAVTRLYPADGSKPKLPPGCSVTTTPVITPSNSSPVAMVLWLLTMPMLISLGYAFIGRQITQDSQEHASGTNSKLPRAALRRASS